MIAAALAPEPAKRLTPRANAAVPMAVTRKFLREKIMARGINYGVRRQSEAATALWIVFGVPPLGGGQQPVNAA